MKNFKFTACIEGSRWLVEYEKLRITQISPRERDFLPFSARDVDPVLEAAAEHLLVSLWQTGDRRMGHAFLRGCLQQFDVVDLFDPADRDIVARSHFIAHEILKDDTHDLVQVFQIIVTEVDPIEQDLPFGGIVETCD